MTPSELRQARCMAAIEDAVGFLDRKADARRAAAMLIQQFQSPGAILEADLAALAKANSGKRVFDVPLSAQTDMIMGFKFND